MLRRLLFLAFVAVSAAPLSAQSLFSTQGLGAPVDPLDPRARALGSIGTGLPGFNASMVNPADLAGIVRRGVSATLQPYYGHEELGSETDNLAGTRFPVIQLIYPFRSHLVVGLGYGGFLDQTWSVFANGTEAVGGRIVDTRDEISSAGALAQVRLSGSYQFSPKFAVGAHLGLYTGGVERELTRTFPDSLEFRSFSERTNWDYRGTFGGIGVRIDPGGATRLAAVATVSAKLKANARAGADLDSEYDMPVRFAFAASQVLGPRLMATASAQWTGWSTTTNYAAPGTLDASPVSAQKTWEFGGGLEWEQLRTSTRVFPLRVGVRYSQLPFKPSGLASSEPVAAKEIVGALGLGLRLASDDFGPLAVADVSVERGQRKGWDGAISGGLTESFWRISASINLFGR
jgi:hypothetical protein